MILTISSINFCISIFGVTQNPARQGPEQPAVVYPAFSGTLESSTNVDYSMVPLKLFLTAILDISLEVCLWAEYTSGNYVDYSFIKYPFYHLP